MQKITVSRDDSIYEAWPDIARLPSGRLVCIFSECTHHGNRDLARLVVKFSDDSGRTWSDKIYLTEKGRRDAYFNCARIVRLSDGRLCVICDFIGGAEDRPGNSRSFLWYSSDGESWSEPREIPLSGIVPDICELKSGRLIAAAHYKLPETEKLAEFCVISDDCGETWSEPICVASDSRFNLCEASLLEVEPNVVVAYLRENSFRGWDCKKAISRDGGLSWEGVYDVPLPGCHRPKAGLLADGRILITYRFLQGGKGGWGSWQNTFGAIMPRESALECERQRQAARIFPIDYDRNPEADLGYTGWLQFENGEIFVVNYILDDAPKAQIRASVFNLSEIEL